MKTIFTGCVKNAFQATHADITTGSGYLNIVGCSSVYIPGSVSSILPSLVETPYVIAITPSTTAGQSNSFMITQYNQKLGIIQDYLYTGDNIPAGASAASEIAKILTWVADINIAGGKSSLGVTATNQTTYVTIQGSMGNPIFTWANLGQAAITDTTNAMLSAVTIVSNTTANPTVITTSGAHGLVVGQVITIVSANNNDLQSGTYRVASTPLTTTLTLTSLDGSTTLAGTATTNATITGVAQFARGTGAQVLALSQIPNSSYPFNTPNLTGDTPIVANNYTTVTVNGYYPGSDVLVNQRRIGYSETFYFDESGANFAAFLAQLRLSLACQITAGVVDPGLVE